jgi:peroxiredoxin
VLQEQAESGRVPLFPIAVFLYNSRSSSHLQDASLYRNCVGDGMIVMKLSRDGEPMSRMRFSYGRTSVYTSGLLLIVLVASFGCGGNGDQQRQSSVEEPDRQQAVENQQPPQNISTETAKTASSEKTQPTKTFAVPAKNSQKSPATIVSNSSTQNDRDPDDDDDVSGEVEPTVPPQEGTPEWLVRQIILLRLKPFPKNYKPDQLSAARRNRNLKIVEMAEEAIPMSLKGSGKLETFNAAVNQLIGARLQLALTGNREDIDAMYDVAEVLFKRDAESKVAADAAYAVADLSHTNAKKYAAQDPGWMKEFAQQARLFATKFPKQQSRAIQLLDAAGRSCEYHHMQDEAVKCYSLIQRTYPKTPHAQQAVAILRRLQLPGQQLKNFGGPTLDGKHLKIEEFKGKVVLIVFWATDAQGISEIMTKLSDFSTHNAKKGFSAIGVCLDENELAVDAFLEQFFLRWPQIIDPNPKKRRWNNPIVKHFGVRDIPMFWLVQRNGILQDVFTSSDPKVLESKLTAILEANKQPQISIPQKTPIIQQIGDTASQLKKPNKKGSSD